MAQIKFRVVFYPDNIERRNIIDETNADGMFYIGLDGYLYENYGTKEEPMWEATFDADYNIEIIK